MGLARRLALGSIVLLGAARAAAFLAYAPPALAAPFETFRLEAKMVLLCDRVAEGLALYPEWHDYPHVANFFGPLYFVVVGLLGRWVGTDLDGLFAIGRAVTFGSALATTLGVAWRLQRRYGPAAGAGGGLLTLGAPPMLGFSVMVRPDLTAELLGLAGFVLSGRDSRSARLAGGALLVLAMLTKQTAVVYVLAAVLALLLEGRARSAWSLLAGCAGGLAGVVGLASALAEPNMVRDLAGESRTPWSLDGWLAVVGRLCANAPDLVYFAAVGLVLWLGGRPREVRWSSLALVVLGSGLALSGKRGADLNYFLSLRVVEALAAGSLWQAAARSTTRRARAVTALAAALGAAALVPSTYLMAHQALVTHADAREQRTPEGQALIQTYRQVERLAGDPNRRLLTDSALFDLYARRRASFGDPWLFRILVETGQIRPRTMERSIDAQAYDLVVTTSDVFSDDYASYEFGLPMVLAEAVRRRYVPAAARSGLFFYLRREAIPRPGPHAPRAARPTRKDQDR